MCPFQGHKVPLGREATRERSHVSAFGAPYLQCGEQSSPGRPGTWEVLISLVPEGLFWLVFGWFWPVFGQFSLIGGLGAHLDVRHWPLFAALLSLAI